ncbi:MAG: hypothetical protein H0T76_02070 [Nannocystis sp.]|nr:UPF0158 family protein [Nannocystis sp.]MBA3545248.1 hypothetical protein [Nannocystis sp.]
MDIQPKIIDWSTLAIAFRDNAPGTRAYLDLIAVRVLVLQAQSPRDAPVFQRIAAHPACFVPLRPVFSREQHAWMLGFTATVEAPELRAKLTQALEATGAFRRFKQVLESAPDERRRWTAQRAQLLREHIEKWLGLHGITVSEPPQGSAGLIGAAEVVISERTLRRLALAQIERLPTEGLQAVIDHLRHLDSQG